MRLINNFIIVRQVITIETFYQPARRIRKHGRFIVITVRMQGINLKSVPHLCVDFIFM